MKSVNRAITGIGVTVVVLASAWVAVALVGTNTPPATTNTEVAQQTSTSVATSTSTSAPASSSTTMPERELSPAWVGAGEELERSTAPFGMAGIVQHRLSADYVRSNPNEWTTPMGALCWAEFELFRTAAMARERERLDHDWIPQVIASLGVEDQVGPSLGPETSRAVIAILEGYTTSTTTAGANTNPVFTSDELNEAITLLELFDYSGGEGNEWLDALDAVASAEWAAAVRAGDGLPADVLQYADGLAANAREQLSSSQPEISGYFYGTFVDGYESFVGLAKYDQNCLRAMIGDPPPPLPDIPDLSTTTTEVGATSTTVRSGSVRVSGAGLFGLLDPGEAGLGVGYSRPAGVGSLDDSTFSHGGVGYEVERLLWWPNGTIRLDVYPDGLDTVVGDDALLVITSAVTGAEYVWRTGDAEHLGAGADFVWDTDFVADHRSLYRVEVRIGVPAVPRNVGLSGTFITWDAPSGGATVEGYNVTLRSQRPDGSTRSFNNVAAFGTEQQFEITYMARLFGEELTVKVRSRNSAGYSPWTEYATFTTPTTTPTSTTSTSSTTTTSPST